MKKAIILFLSIVLFNSCIIEKDEPLGQWDDIIKLSTRKVDFVAKADSVIIKTEGDWWWVEHIQLNDSIYSYYGNDSIDLESDHYKIVGDDFVVERRDKNTLFVKLNENTSGVERKLVISLEAGDYFDYVAITQKGK